MLAAVLEGDGLDGVAELAAAEAGAPVAIVLPARGLIAARPTSRRRRLVDYVCAVDGTRRPSRSSEPSRGRAGARRSAAVLALRRERQQPAAGLKLDREEVLRTAALAALAEVAATDARDRVAEDLRGSLLEDLRAQPHRDGGDAAPRRAARLRSQRAAPSPWSPRSAPPARDTPRP